MSLRNYSSTAAQTTLASGVDASTTTFAVSATTGFPSVPFIIAVDAGAAGQELVLVTNVAGTNLTVTRGYDSTVAVSHDAGAVVAHSHGAIDFREANQHVNATAGVHGLTGAPVGTTDTQTLANKTLTAPTLTAPVATGSLAGFGGAWTSVALTPVAEVGTIGSASGTLWYSKVGRTVAWHASITVTDAGSGTGAVRFNLPFAPARDCMVGTGRESSSTGHTVNVFGNTANVYVLKYDNTGTVVTGYILRLGGTYEASA